MAVLPDATQVGHPPPFAATGCPGFFTLSFLSCRGPVHAFPVS